MLRRGAGCRARIRRAHPPRGGGGVRPGTGDRPPPLPYGGAVTTMPGRFRGPFARWPRTADAMLATVIFLVMVFVVDGPGDSLVARPIADVPVLELVVYPVAGAALYLRRRTPLVALGAALAGWVLVLGSEHSQLGFAVIVALYSTGRYAERARWGAIGIALATVLIALDLSNEAAVWWSETIFGGVVMFVAWYIGRRLRLRQQRAAEQVREREAETRRIVAEERTRIARELHDVVAHRVSLMTVQASGAKAVAAEDPAAALQAMGTVEEAGRQALAELRHLLGVLRPEADNGDGLGPQPGLADLPRLVEQIRQAGVDVDLSTGPLPATLPSRMDLFAYRIVQEALTNVLKHAGPGTRTEVGLRTDGGAVVIEVVDDGRSTNGGPELDQDGVAGHGIIGMRERALLLGGSLAAGPRPEGGFRVVARLPVGSETA
jgi:signal transduction histidine kinase